MGIAYQNGTEDRLYIATDAGIYVRDEGSLVWEKYGDFPNVRVTEIKINYCLGKIRAATFGRSVWEGKLLPSTGSAEIEKVIDSPQEEVWDGNITLTTSLRIKSGSILTIKGLLNMPVEGRIIVEKDALLKVIGGTITNSCGKNWDGIDIEGDRTRSQFFENGIRHQGYVFLSGATIQNSIYGIRTFDSKAANIDATSGGMIIAVGDTHFHNNGQAIEFLDYQNYDPNTGEAVGNLSVFSNCTFRIDDAMPDPSIFERQVYMSHVVGIEFWNCHFSNSINNVLLSDERGIGVFSNNAGFTVEGAYNNGNNTWDHSTVTGFRIGIASGDFYSINTFQNRSNKLFG